ncbi:hypothetical protein P9761_05435 [Brevibacillus centrosporus]|uniref:hypothetical protein n=1 Tax=Brevibacillus centrosporus TaxID=54910 RepID=UPI002E1D5B6B|nr:hypothetical protein [Brevibacillus centrosporus]
MKPFSVIAYHNKFFNQIRDAYIIGAFYPALTAACSLGERILNHLILTFRDQFKSTPEYRSVYRKSSFDNWDVPINALESWGILLPNVVEDFRSLKEVRNRSLHFNPELDVDEKPSSLQAIHLLSEIISFQFGSAPQGQHWYISGIPGGVAIIKQDAEEWPFVQQILIPNSEYVGYRHKLKGIGDGDFIPVDDYNYPEVKISDEEYVRLYKESR